MSRGTRKAGITGKYGPRYGVKIRKQIKSVSRHRTKLQRCPECQANAVKRVASGIWVCNHCNLKFAASAYSVRTRSYKREEAKSQLDRFQREDSRDLNGEPEEPEIGSEDIAGQDIEPGTPEPESNESEVIEASEDEELSSTESTDDEIVPMEE
jgi:large subunit ribosomal protein L37Ae